MFLRKRNLFYLLLSAVLSVAGCKSGEIRYVTLAQLAAQSSSVASEFDINIQDTYVTAASDSYILLEDKTFAAQITVSSPISLKRGQIISCHLKGVSTLRGGALELEDVEISGLSSSDAAQLPYVEASISSITDSLSFYTHKRVLVKDITFTDRLRGRVGENSRIIQNGTIAKVQTQNPDYEVSLNDQGDIYVYPSGSLLHVYDASEFSRHEVISPLARKSAYGVYKLTSDSAEDVFVYTSGTDQLAYCKRSDGCFSRIQSYENERVLVFTLPDGALSEGSFVTVGVSVEGMPEVPQVEAREMFVEKISGTRAYFMDCSSGYGYIVYME